MTDQTLTDAELTEQAAQYNEATLKHDASPEHLYLITESGEIDYSHPIRIIGTGPRKSWTDEIDGDYYLAHSGHRV